MDDEMSNSARRMSMRTRKVAPKMAAALASSDNRTQAMLARLEALENDNAGLATIQIDDDDEASLDGDVDEDEGRAQWVFLHFTLFLPFQLINHNKLSYSAAAYQKKQNKNTKRKTRQAKALENAKKAPRTFIELLNEANLESLPSHVPSYLTAAVGPPSFTARRHFCTVCGFSSNYTCVQCGMRFCSTRCQTIHNDTRCLKFVA
ncbi:hypothetical protein RD792_009166 [Penstemon davidsonii]|uniref:HIT-type domain-containing protein n=1 Tax=Penstemon davidsonii TaxID=160366 RepID=A0ABR0DB41_9LAMI|nr:hypothetical protein RD792_009166 [Penstemon davidsonii]